MKDTFHIRNLGFSVTGYFLGLFTVLKSLPVLLMEAVSEAAVLYPVNYSCISGLMKAQPPTMAVHFLVLHSIHPSPLFVPRCPLLCFGFAPAVQLNVNSGAEESKAKKTLRAFLLQ